ncbi:hypothetical protein AGMMS50276_14430 [Synergistales bacterium]|nr:hypothetical protein AGMMS50276_14430 [Synergistales bacterium]
MKKILKKRTGVTLVETLIAATIIGAFLPCAFGVFGKLSVSELKLQNNADKASCAAWWLNRLPANPIPSDFASMPRGYKIDKTRDVAFFAWKIEEGSHGSFAVTLSVTNAPHDDVPFVAKLVY